MIGRKGAGKGGPGETQRSGFAGERKNGGMSETCRLRRGEGYEARSDDKQEKAWGLQAPPADHNRPQCGRFKGRERAFRPKIKEVSHMVRDKQKFALWLTP